MTRLDVIAVAREFLGVPYRHLGRDNVLGLDCIGLLLAIADRLGVESLDDEEYRTGGRVRWRGERLSSELDLRLGERKQLRQPADICVFVARPGGRVEQHLGIMTDHEGDGLLHVETAPEVRRVVEHAFDLSWQRRYLWAYDFPGVED